MDMHQADRVVSAAAFEGWAIVDTGMQTPDTATAWQQLLRGPLGGLPPARLNRAYLSALPGPGSRGDRRP